MARPTKMTKETVEKLESGFLKGLSDAEACVYAGIAKQTLYNYCEKHPEFIDRKETLKNAVKMHAKINLADKIKNDRDIELSKWYLERKCKEEFAPKSEVELGGNMTVNNPFEGLTTEELRKLANAETD